MVELISEPYQTLISDGSAGFLDFTVTQSMSGPVYMYYELTDFYQNNRRYVESVDSAQLDAGDSVSTSPSAYSSNCDPWYETSVTDGAGVSTKKQLYPCGLVARSVFNDTFTIIAASSSSPSNFSEVALDESPGTICWSQDVAHKYNQANPYYEKSGTRLIDAIDMWLLQFFPPQVCMPKNPAIAPLQNPVATKTNPDGMKVVDCDFTNITAPTCNFSSPCVGDFEPVANPSNWGVNNGHFINWMRTAGLSSFRKLYGKIDRSFEPGDVIRVGVQANFPAASYGGTKQVVLSTVTWAGGKNIFLGIGYLIVGGLSLIFTCIYGYLHHKHPRRGVDIDYFSRSDSQ